MHLLDSVIAFAAIMLIASLIVTAGTQLTISLLGLRGANLRSSLTDLFENACDDADSKRYGKVIARRVLHHPLLSGSVFSRFGIQIDKIPYMPTDAAGKLRWAGNGIPFQSWLLGALSGFFLWPVSLEMITRLTSFDIDPLSNAIAVYVPFLNFVDHPWRSGAIAGAVLGGLIGRWRLATTVRVDELAAVLNKLSTPAGGTLPDPAQRAMLVISGEIESGPRQKTNSASAKYERVKYDSAKYDNAKYDGGKYDSGKYDKFERDRLENDDDQMSAAVDDALSQISAQSEPRIEGVSSWFEHAMDRASQRFTLQARAITVVLAVALVCCAHLDAIRLFRSLSTDAETRAQLAASSDTITKQAAQLSRTHEDGANVPDLYRTAMVDILQATPANAEAAKPKAAHSPRRATTTTGASAAAAAGDATGSSDGVEVASADGGAVAIAALPATETPASERRHKKTSRAKTPPAEPAKPIVVIPAADQAILDAKAQASKALDATVAFSSREDAVTWLRATLDGDPIVENLVSSYNRAVNAQLVTDTDKLLDQAASLDHAVARSEFQLFPDQFAAQFPIQSTDRFRQRWTDWRPKPGELPGLLVAIALLSLGAAICFNLLNSLASLRPELSAQASLPTDRRIRLDDRRYSKRREPATREPVTPQVKPQATTPNKLEKKTELAESSPTIRI